MPKAAKECRFCRIARGEIDAEIVFDEQAALAFLDHRPLFLGHSLLIPREHRETLLDLTKPELSALFESAQRLAAAIQAAMGAQGTFVAMNNVVSQSIPHLHIHVVPRNRGDGLRGFFWPRTKYESATQMREVGDAIRTELSRLA